MAALREFLLRFCEAAHARGGIAVPVARALVCAHARGRAIRLEAELASRAALLCAEARARAAQAYLLHAQRQAGAAAVVAGRRLLQAKDFTAYTVLRVAYGNSPPTRRTADEWLYIFDMCLLRVWNMLRRADKLLNLLEICIAISPHSVGIIIATIYTPIAIPVAQFYKTLLSTAPESCCPFLGIRCVEFDDEFPAGKGLAAVALLCGRIGGVVLLTSGLLCISLCIDMGTIGYSLAEKLFRWNRDAGLAELPSTVAELKNLKSIVLYDQYNPGRYPHGEPSKRYFVLSGGTTVYASLLRLLVLKFKDVLVPASVEVDLSSIEPGTTVTVKWRGKPVFIRRRTHDEIALARSMVVQEDAERVKKNPEWLVVVGRFGCTCIPLPNSGGDFGGWFCPCHGSHYDDISGPAPFNLEVPAYSFLEDNKMLIGSRTPSTSQERRSPRGELGRE